VGTFVSVSVGFFVLWRDFMALRLEQEEVREGKGKENRAVERGRGII
jgi:hypothetical protein